MKKAKAETFIYIKNLQCPCRTLQIAKEAQANWQKLELEVPIEENGYIYIYMANESMGDVNVHFDDLEVQLIDAPVTNASDYYPFGLAMTGRSYSSEKYRFGYQGQFAELDEETGWNSFEAREYDPVIGRPLTVDPARQFASPYVWVGNNPISRIDPTGGISPIFDKTTGEFLGTDSEGFKGEILFMDAANFTEGMDHGVAMNIGVSIVDVSLSLGAWANFGNFMWSDPRAANLDLGLLYNGSMSVGQGFSFMDPENNFKNTNITENRFIGGIFAGFLNASRKNYGGTMKVSISVGMDGKLESGPLMGNTMNTMSNFVNNLMHEYRQGSRTIGGTQLAPGAASELEAIQFQMNHSSWPLTTPSFQQSVENYRNSFR